MHQSANGVLFVVAAERPPAVQQLMAQSQDGVEAKTAPADLDSTGKVAATAAVSSQSAALRDPSVVWLSPATLTRTFCSTRA